MKAIVYTEYGPPEVLQLKELHKPVPLDDEVLIRVRAAEASKADCEMRSFKFAVQWFWLPLRFVMGLRRPKRNVLGGYYSGEIESVGDQVTMFKKGDQVFGGANLRLGAYGEYMCLPASYTMVPKPENLSFEEAAAVPMGGLNALHFMRRANIQAGESVLIIGAGGSIGTFAVQIARAMGAEVTAVDAGIKEDLLRRAGADHFIDYSREDFTSNSRRYDVVFDIIAGSSYSACVKALKPKGRYLMANPRMSGMLRSMFTSAFSDKAALFAFAGEKPEELLALKTMLEEGTIKAFVDKVYPLAEAAAAHRRVETEQRLGIVVLSVS